MIKAVVIYGSTTGNTETLSESVFKGLVKGGVEVMLKNVIEAEVEELTDYDLIVLGASTWGEGEMQDDFQGFYDSMYQVSLAGKKAAAFGPGDSLIYPDTFCDAVTMLEEKLKERGAEIVIESLEVDGDVDEALEDAQEWGLDIAKTL